MSVSNKVDRRVEKNAHKSEVEQQFAHQHKEIELLQQQIALQQQQMTLLQQVAQQLSKPSESVQSVSDSENKTTITSSSVWAKFKCNQKTKLSEDEYWHRQQQDYYAMLFAQQQEEQERERQWLRGSGLVA